jgi:hypothetical protein
MKINKETKISIIECNIESIKMGDKDGLITIDNETFNMGLDYLLEQERYEDCCILRDNKDMFIGSKVKTKIENTPYVKLLNELF